MLECIECREEKSLASFPLLYGKFLLSRLEKGQGLTVANTLRRVLLYEIPAVGITSVSIQKNRNTGSHRANAIRGGIDSQSLASGNLFQQISAQQNFDIDLNTHEFSTLPGLKESVLEVLFNLKSLIFRQEFPYDSPQKVLLYLGENAQSETLRNKVSNPLLLIEDPKQYKTPESRIIKASHLKLPQKISLVFPDQYIAEISGRIFIPTSTQQNGDFQKKLVEASDTSFYFECTIDKITQNALSGLGASTFKGFGATQGAGSASGVNPSTQNRRVLPIDGSVFPVKKVNYTIEYDTFGKEVVFLEIWTNGALQPQEVLNQALEKVLALFQRFTPFT